MKSPINTTNPNHGPKRWGNSRLASRSPSLASRSPSHTRAMAQSVGGSKLRKDQRNHPTELCDIAGAVSSSPLRSLTPQRNSTRPGIPGNSKAYSRPCKYFAVGKCMKGVNCTFIHETPPQKLGLHESSKYRRRASRNRRAVQSNNSDFSDVRLPIKQEPNWWKYMKQEFKDNSVPMGSSSSLTRGRPTSAPFSLNHPGASSRSVGSRRTPAPLNLTEDLDSENNLRPLSPENVARSRPTSRASGGPNATLRLPSTYGGSKRDSHLKDIYDDSFGRISDDLLGGDAIYHREEQLISTSNISNNGEHSVTKSDDVKDASPIRYTPNSMEPKRFKFDVETEKALTQMRSVQPSASVDSTGRITPSKAFTRPCKYYAQGFCVKGSACTFLHSTQDSSALSDRLSQQQVSSKEEAAKPVDPSKMFVRLCRYYIKNQCAKGANCTFIHPTPEQLQAIKMKSTSPSPSPMGAALCIPVPASQSMSKVSPRTPVQSVQNDIRSASMSAMKQLPSVLPSQSQSPRTCVNKSIPASASVPREIGQSIPMAGDNGSLICTNINQTKAKTKPCKFYALGQCLKGDRCTFIHDKAPEKPVPTIEPSADLGTNKRVSSPRFARVENRAYSFNELDDIEDYVAGLKVAQKQVVGNSNVAAVILTFNSNMRAEIKNTLTEIHNTIKQLNNDSEENEYGDLLECYSLGCTHVDPERIADDVRRSDMEFRGRPDTLCQPRFGHILRALKRKHIVEEDCVYVYQIEAVSAKYAFKYPYANISMVFQKGDKGERIEQVAIRGLFEKQHVVLERNLWDKAFKARAPPIYLPYFLTGEQLSKYPESRRVWFCGAHSLFVPTMKNIEIVKLDKGDDWPAGADVPSKYAANPVPVPTMYIRPKKQMATFEKTENKIISLAKVKTDVEETVPEISGKPSEQMKQPSENFV